jgi:hypothetical protein
VSARPPAVERARTPGAFLTRGDLRELGLDRRAVDAIFRAVDVIVLPGYSRPMVKAEDYMAYSETAAEVPEAFETPMGDYVYVFCHALGVKIGITFDGERRRRTIQNAAGIAVEHIASFPVANRARAEMVENWVLDDLCEYRTHGEWFSCDADLAVRAVRWAVGNLPSFQDLA